MKVREYLKEYSNGERITFKELLGEVWELIAEIFKLNRKGIEEEFKD